jgi:hypothetical protein
MHPGMKSGVFDPTLGSSVWMLLLSCHILIQIPAK